MRLGADQGTAGWLRSGLARVSVAGLAIGAISIGALHSSTVDSDAAPGPVPSLAGDALAALADRDGTASRDQARAASPRLLAQVRSQSFRSTARELTAARRDAALAQRTEELAGVAEKIGAQSESLRDRGNFLMPTAGGFDSRFGMRRHPILGYYKLHNGDDIGGDCGQPIWAAHDGVVTKAATGGYNGGSGNNVKLDAGQLGGNHVETAYLHMNTVAVREGQQVRKGELLGTVGSTGLSTACHLHFSVYEDGTAVAPKKYLKK